MSFRTDHITLDLQRSSREPVSKLRYRQHDKGATIEIAIVNGTSTVDLTGHTVHFMCETRGGLVETVLQVSGSTCTYTLDPATTAYQGVVKPYLEIRNGDTVIASTSLFEIQLDGAADIAGPQAEATSSTLDALTDQTNTLAQQTAAALASANAATAAANTAATKADASTSASATQTAACKAATNAAMDVATTALSKRRADTLYANALIGNAQGDMVHVEDAWEADAVGLRVMGKSAQDGTPTPDAPIEIDVVDGPVTVNVADVSQALVNQQTITLPTDHNYLASLPDGTRDELVLRSDGVAVLVEWVGKRVFNGSEAWSLLPGVSYMFRLRDTTLLANYSQLICDRYTVRQYAYTSETQGVTTSVVSAPNTFCFRDTTIDQTVNAWKAKLAAYNVTVYYALATTTVRYSADNGATWSTTDLAAGQSAIPLHKGTNNVWCTDPLSPEVSLDYVQDTNAVINELRAAIVASGATN